MQPEGYQRTAAHEATHWWFRARRALIAAQVERARAELGPLSILDFGCGTGFNLGILARYGQVAGADLPHPELAALALHPELPRLDASRPLDPHFGRFDLVTAFDVLEHLDDDRGGLATLARLCRPGGQVLLTVPAYTWLWGGEDVLSEHRRRYTEGGLRALCAGLPLQVLFCSYFGLPLLPAMSALVVLERLAKGPARSRVWPAPAALNSALGWLLSMETVRVGQERWRLPLGPSLVLRARVSEGR